MGFPVKQEARIGDIGWAAVCGFDVARGCRRIMALEVNYLPESG